MLTQAQLSSVPVSDSSTRRNGEFTVALAEILPIFTVEDVAAISSMLPNARMAEISDLTGFDALYIARLRNSLPQHLKHFASRMFDCGITADDVMSLWVEKCGNKVCLIREKDVVDATTSIQWFMYQLSIGRIIRLRPNIKYSYRFLYELYSAVMEKKFPHVDIPKQNTVTKALRAHLDGDVWVEYSDNYSNTPRLKSSDIVMDGLEPGDLGEHDIRQPFFMLRAVDSRFVQGDHGVDLSDESQKMYIKSVLHSLFDDRYPLFEPGCIPDRIPLSFAYYLYVQYMGRELGVDEQDLFTVTMFNRCVRELLDEGLLENPSYRYEDRRIVKVSKRFVTSANLPAWFDIEFLLSHNYGQAGFVKI